MLATSRARSRTVRWIDESATGDPARSYSTFVAERERAEERQLAARARALARTTEFRYPNVTLKLRMEEDGSAASAAATLTTLAATPPQASQASRAKKKKTNGKLNRNGGKVARWKRPENVHCTSSCAIRLS